MYASINPFRVQVANTGGALNANGAPPLLVLGKASSVITISAQAGPGAGVTLTPTNPFITFSPAILSFR